MHVASFETVHAPLPRRTGLGFPGAVVLTERTELALLSPHHNRLATFYVKHPVLRFMRLFSELAVCHLTTKHVEGVFKVVSAQCCCGF